MGVDRFGNSHAPNLSYARGAIIRSTDDDFRKLQRAWSLIRARGPANIYVLTGLEHSLPPIMTAEDVVKRIAAECAYVDERGAVGIRLKPVAAIVRQYGEQFRAARRQRRPRSAKTPPLL
jgi:hypothetical protein